MSLKQSKTVKRSGYQLDAWIPDGYGASFDELLENLLLVMPSEATLYAQSGIA